MDRVCRRFYFRTKPIRRFVWEMATDRQRLVRRLRQGHEFFVVFERAANHRPRAPVMEPEASPAQYASASEAVFTTGAARNSRCISPRLAERKTGAAGRAQ